MQLSTGTLQDSALRFLEDMQAKYGFRPEARHVNYVVEAEALAGNLADAAGLMEASGRCCWCLGPH